MDMIGKVRRMKLRVEWHGCAEGYSLEVCDEKLRAGYPSDILNIQGRRCGSVAERMGACLLCISAGE